MPVPVAEGRAARMGAVSRATEGSVSMQPSHATGGEDSSWLHKRGNAVPARIRAADGKVALYLTEYPYLTLS